MIDRRDIMAVHIGHHVPPIRCETARRIVGEPAARFPIDRNTVVVVEDNELAQSKRPGERTGFVRNALHQASITGEHVRVVIDDRAVRHVELRSEKLLGERHADGVRKALSERSRRRFDTGRHADFGMARCLRMQLAKALQLAHRQVVAGKMQQRVLQHRPMAIRQNKTIAVRPVRIRGIVA